MGLGRALLIGDDHGWSPLNDGIRRQSWLFEENALAASQSQTMLNALPSLCRESSVCRCGLAALVKDSNSRARQIGRRFVVDKMLIGLEQFCVFGPVESLHPTVNPMIRTQADVWGALAREYEKLGALLGMQARSV